MQIEHTLAKPVTGPREGFDDPVLSPDGRFVLFDVFRPSGGDIWSLEGL